MAKAPAFAGAFLEIVYGFKQCILSNIYTNDNKYNKYI